MRSYLSAQCILWWNGLSLIRKERQSRVLIWAVYQQWSNIAKLTWHCTFVILILLIHFTYSIFRGDNGRSEWAEAMIPIQNANKIATHLWKRFSLYGRPPPSPHQICANLNPSYRLYIGTPVPDSLAAQFRSRSSSQVAFRVFKISRKLYNLCYQQLLGIYT